MNSLPALIPRLCTAIVPPCNSTNALASGKPRPSPPSPPYPCPSARPKAVKSREDLRQDRRVNAPPVVLHPQYPVIRLRRNDEMDISTIRGISGGIVEQIGDDLGEPRKVTHDVHGMTREFLCKPMPAGLEGRPDGLDGVAGHRAQIDTFSLHGHPA